MTKVNQEALPRFFSFPSVAKLNLFLHIVGRRANGYHELQSLFQFVDYGDTLEIAIDSSPAITLLTPIKGVSNDDNLIVKAAKILQKATNCSLGAQIKLDKVLPMGGGVGGGSSNAATVLHALNTMWKTHMSTQELADLGVQLGADVPIFVHGIAAFVEGIGEIITPAYPQEAWFLVAKPQASISTQSVFTAEDLCRNTPKMLATDYDDAQLFNEYKNDCQNVVIKRSPEVANLLAWLIEYAPSRMTGTGACIFSRFDTENEARQVAEKLPSNVDYFVARGVNKSPLLAALEKVKNSI